MKKAKKKQKKKLRIDRLLLFGLLIYILANIAYFGIKQNITNIFISGNYYLTDQEIIEMANIENYPSTLKNSSSKIEKKLKNNLYIKEVNVNKKWFTQVYISVIENRPLFYYDHSFKTILLDGKESDIRYTVPTLINYVTDNVYSQFLKEVAKLDISILSRISEIEFMPNEVDDSRFFLTMQDGNYVYVNVDTFYKMNKYLDIIQNFDNVKGILYLDYGNNFEVLK